MWYMDMVYGVDHEVLHVLGTLASSLLSERRNSAGGFIPKLGSVTLCGPHGSLVRMLQLKTLIGCSFSGSKILDFQATGKNGNDDEQAKMWIFAV